MAAERTLGPEVDYCELTVLSGRAARHSGHAQGRRGRTLHELEEQEFASYGRPIFLLGITRGGRSVTPSAELKVERWMCSRFAGHASTSTISRNRSDTPIAPTSESDVAYMGVGIRHRQPDRRDHAPRRRRAA